MMTWSPYESETGGMLFDGVELVPLDAIADADARLPDLWPAYLRHAVHIGLEDARCIVSRFDGAFVYVLRKAREEGPFSRSEVAIPLEIAGTHAPLSATARLVWHVESDATVTGLVPDALAIRSGA